jgi:hypothetical protein
MKRLLAIAVSALALAFAAAGTATAAPNAANASCMGLGSSFYAHGAGSPGVHGVRADISHLVKEFFSPAPGQHFRLFAHEKEGGSIPAPCGSRIE